MAWSSGTIASSTPWVDLSSKLKAICGLDDTGGRSPTRNWSFVGNVPAGTGAGQSGSTSYSLDVFKCAGSGTDANDAATDWYFVIPIPAPTTQTTPALYFQVAESFDGINQFKRQIPGNVSTAPVGSGYWANDTYNTFVSLSAKLTNSAWTLNTTGFSYWMKLTRNDLIFSVLVGTTNLSLYVGLLDSGTAISDPCPLVLVGSSSGGAAKGVTRLPGVSVSSVSFMWFLIFRFWLYSVQQSETNNGTNRNDLWQGNKIHVSRIAVYSAASPVDWYRVGGFRGLVKPNILGFGSGGTVNLGDTMVIGANTWTVVALNLDNAATWVTRAI
jgi:hypothetical protein